MTKEDDNDSLFSKFKQHLEQSGGGSPSQAEADILEQITPRVHKMARRELTRAVRRAFDSHDITSTVLRRVVGCVRQGKLKLDTEGQFMSMLTTMTKRAIIDKHAYLTRLLRDQDRDLASSRMTSDNDAAVVDWTAADDVRRRQADSAPQTPVDEVLFTEKLENLNSLCSCIQNNCHLQPDEWHLFKRRILEEMSFKEIGAEMDISADAARMRLNRIIEELRPKLRRFEEWLDQRPS